jgi:hypothetical protein
LEPVVDEHADGEVADGPGDPGPPPAGEGDAQHADMRAALDEIEAVLDEAAATIARMP